MKFSCIAGLALLMTLPSAAAGAETLNMSADTVVSQTSLNQWLAEGRKHYESGAFLAGALKFAKVVDGGGDDSSNATVQDAQFYLGASLHELGLHQSALTRLEPIVDAGSGHPKYLAALPYLLRISRATNSDPSVLQRLAEYPPTAFPKEHADELNYLAGQFHFGESDLDSAVQRFAKVTKGTPLFYAKAKYLEGVINVAQSGLGTEASSIKASKLTDASNSFKQVLRFNRDGNSSDEIEKVAEAATLALGRLFYSTRQYDVAVRYYGQISRDSPEWLDSLWEVSWVHYQLKDYPRALGNLLTLNSPYFEDQYFPESWVLQALILFYNCRYDESDEVVKGFVNDYYPLLQKLKKEVNQFGDPNAFYQWLAKLSQSNDSEYSSRFKRIFNAALEDKKLRRKFDLIGKLTRELREIDDLAGPSGAKTGMLSNLKADIVGYRSLVVGEAGGLAQARLLRVMSDLRKHLGGALKIKGETLKARRGDTAESVKREQLSSAAARVDIEVDDEHIEWPFRGEYWRDELGSYIYDIGSQCEASARNTP